MGGSVRQRFAAIKRGDPSPRHVGGSPRRLTPEEHGRISVKIVSNCFTMSRICSRKAIRFLRLHCWRGWRLHLHGVSRKISTSRRLDLDVICFSDEKIFRVDAAAPGRSFHTFIGEKWCDVTTRPTSSSHPCTELHDLVTLHGSSTMFMRRLNM